MIEVKRRHYMDLTEAMAHSNNNFFEAVGSRLGFDRVIKYDSMFGLGQRVGYNIVEEQPGSLPSHPPIFGGVARMSSFGASIRITPFQLASLVSMLANGGTQFYLQYPRSDAERASFAPRVRQQFDIQPLIPEIREGLLAAVLYGTAKRSYDPYDGEQALGKTGTCNDEGVGGRLGWFVSYADQANPKIVIVVLPTVVPASSPARTPLEIAGRIYHNLYQRNYFVARETTTPSSPPTPPRPAPHNRSFLAVAPSWIAPGTFSRLTFSEFWRLASVVIEYLSIVVRILPPAQPGINTHTAASPRS